MKTKKIEINSQLELTRAIDILKEERENLYIDKNLFSVNKISTILKPSIEEDLMMMNKKMIIEFSYADKVMPMDVKLIFNFHDDTCIAFLDNSKIVNETQLNSIWKKMKDFFKENQSYDDEHLKELMDDVAVNETLLILTQAVNKEDCENIKNDFTSKYESWKKKITEENAYSENLMNKLFSALVSLKIWKKVII